MAESDLATMFFKSLSASSLLERRMFQVPLTKVLKRISVCSKELFESLSIESSQFPGFDLCDYKRQRARLQYNVTSRTGSITVPLVLLVLFPPIQSVVLRVPLAGLGSLFCSSLCNRDWQFVMSLVVGASLTGGACVSCMLVPRLGLHVAVLAVIEAT